MAMSWKDIYLAAEKISEAEDGRSLFEAYGPAPYVSSSKDFMDTLSKMADDTNAREEKLARAGAIRRKIEAGDIVHLTLEAINKLFMINGLSFNGAYFVDGAKYTDAARAIEDRMAFKVIQIEKNTVLDGIGEVYNTYKLAFYGAENYRDGIRSVSSEKADVEHVKDLINGDEVLMSHAVDEEIIYVGERGGYTASLLEALED